MGVTNTISIKPKQNIFFKLNKLFQKSNLTKLEQTVSSNVAGSAAISPIVKKVEAFTDEDCEHYELAPVEVKCFTSAVVMAIRESLKVTFNDTDGHTENASISLDFSSQKLEKAFGLYASGSFRRSTVRHHLGNDLETLIPDNNVSRPDNYNITIDCQYHEIDGCIQIKTYHVHRNVDNWITRLFTKSAKSLVNDINRQLESLEV